jgi:ADP-ribose pyrophosphatase
VSDDENEDTCGQVTAVDDPSSLAADADEWPVVETDVVWENPYFSAGYDVVEQPDGESNTFYWIDPADVVVVVAVEADSVVLVEQYDGRLRESLLTCPGGSVDEGESFVDAGVRELREETGFRAGHAELVTTYYPTAWARMEQAVVYASDLDPGPADREPGEFLDVYTAPVDIALGAVRQRSPSFGPSLASLLAVRDRGLA